jgi:hypothetical protein
MIVSRRRPQRPQPPLDADEAQQAMGFFRAGPRRPPGPIRKVVGLVVLVFAFAYGTWALIHAATTGEIPERHGWARLADDPFGFWFHVVLCGAGLLPIYGLVPLALYGLATRGRATRKIDAYLQRRSNEGGQASAIPPRLR